MPTYEYLCSDCRSIFEIKRAIKDIDAPATCPECHGEHVARQVSRVTSFSHGDGGTTALGGGGCGCASCGGGTCASCASSRN